MRRRRWGPETWRDAPFFLEIFGGAGPVGRALVKQGYKVFAFDAYLGTVGDLLVSQAFLRCRRLLDSGHCLGVIVGPPRARVSVDSVGSAGASVSKAECRAAGRLVSRGAAAGIPVLCVAPPASLLWMNRKMDAHRNAPTSSTILTTSCGWGEPWHKLFQIVGANVLDLHLLHKRCSGTGGWCSFTGRPHFHMWGRDSAGTSWRRRAAAIPRHLARAIAHYMIDQAFVRHQPLGFYRSQARGSRKLSLGRDSDTASFGTDDSDIESTDSVSSRDDRTDRTDEIAAHTKMPDQKKISYKFLNSLDI